jgi:hypothetical protein
VSGAIVCAIVPRRTGSAADGMLSARMCRRTGLRLACHAGATVANTGDTPYILLRTTVASHESSQGRAVLMIDRRWLMR